MSNFQERLAALRQQQGAAAPAVAPVAPIQPPAASAAGVAGVAGHARPVSGTNDGAKEALRRLDLLDVYTRWFQPISVRQGGGDEVNCSCFNTSFHAKGDRNPQFGINTAKQTYYCHACGVTGDIIDLAAVYFGYADGSYRCEPGQVHEVVKAAGEELLGFQFHMTPAGWQRVPEMEVLALPATPGPTPAVMPSPHPTPASGLTLVEFDAPGPVQEFTKDLPDGFELPPPPPDAGKPIEDGTIGLDWRSILPEGSPMYRYLDLVSADDSPEEYHFWQFMVLIGLLCGKDVGLADSEVVYGNLLVCIVGQTGVGKSRSERHLNRLIEAAVPFDDTSDCSKGIKRISGAGSGEYMMREFTHSIPDPRSTAKQKFPDIVHPGVRGLVRWSELSEMVGKAANAGSSVREKIMELYDAAGDVQFGSIAAGKTTVRAPFGSVLTTTQPESVRHLLSRNEVKSGFLNRWVFVSGIRKRPHPRGSIIDPTPIRPDVLAIARWAEDRAAHHRGILDIDDVAGDEYDRFIMEHAIPLKQADAMFGRLDLLFKKLVLLLAANMREPRVSIETVRQAEQVFDYVVHSLESFGAALARSDVAELQEEIIARIERNIAATGEGLSGYKLSDSLKRRYDADEVRTALRTLEDLGRVFQATPQRTGPGRRPKLYYIQED